MFFRNERECFTSCIWHEVDYLHDMQKALNLLIMDERKSSDEIGTIAKNEVVYAS